MSEVVRICEKCGADLVMDFQVPGCEYRCPACGNYEEYFGKTRNALTLRVRPGETQ